ncbi:NAD(P)-dependent oxidoreductase [Sphingosinicella soli]|uniref:NAD(P)-dependent oxidoreductase n=1 Tax=Sphingosinicella soli TaxID=333708 RepID=UPI001FB0CF46|nr:NAD(P)-dependent oxidoreductase [Sphingosinicella soli]
MHRSGVIGLGQIGAGVSTCLARAGLLEAVYDVRPDAAGRLEGVPPVLGSPAKLASCCDVILLAVISAQQVLDVLTGPSGIVSAARPGLNIVLLSTVSLSDLEVVRQTTDAASIGLIDCGVTGGPSAAANNGLICFVGAEADRLTEVLPVLDGFAQQVVHMGGPGSGMAAKIARNVIVYNAWRAGYEGAQLAAAAGINVVKFAQAIEASSVGGPTIWLTRPDPATDGDELRLREATLGLVQKDLAAALELGGALGIDLPMATLSRQSARAIMGIDMFEPSGDGIAYAGKSGSANPAISATPIKRT